MFIAALGASETTDDKGTAIDNNESNTIRSANLARRAVGFPRTASRKSDRKGHNERSSARSRTARTKEPAFAVKVKRRWDSAREKLFWGLGLYGQMDEMPLGLVVDVWV